MLDFTRYFATRLRGLLTPQSEPIPGSTHVPNSAGGHAWPVDQWVRLDRFLVLGTEGGTWYIGERALTRENAEAVVACVAADGPRTVRRIVEVSLTGRAPRNDPALFALAIAASLGDAATRAAAWEALPRVARTSTHLFHWLRYLKGFRGWGRGVRRAVAGWYNGHTATGLAYQVLKYPSRDGWSHRDVLRLAHPTAPTAAHERVFRYATRGAEALPPVQAAGEEEVQRLLDAVASLRGRTPAEAARVIVQHGLTREMVPTELLRHAEVWEALLQRMPFTAMLRNLGVMSKVGLLAPFSEAARTVTTRLANREALAAARVHPVALLVALKTYGQGHGVKGRGRWQALPQVVDALDQAFYLAFPNAPSTGQRVMLALDVSGSMAARVFGLPQLTCREASAAMALVTAATEPAHQFTAFTAGSHASRWSPRLGSGLTPLTISPRQRLDEALRAVSNLPFGGTDCALPMREALRQRWPVDLFVVYTDNETWAGSVHPAQALRQYRERMGIPARLVVVGMASNGFSIADPDDAGMLDVVGFDTATPQLIADFGRGDVGAA